MRCWSSTSSTTTRPMFGSFMQDPSAVGRSTWVHAQPEVAPRARGHPHTIVNTVTDDPNALSGATAAAGPAATIGTWAAPSRRHARVDERVTNELRAAATERPESLGRVRHPHVRLRADAIGVDDRQPAAGRPRDRRRLLDPRLDSDRPETSRPAPATGSHACERGASPGLATSRSRRCRRAPIRSTRRPPGSSTARRSPRATWSTASTVASAGGGAPSQRRTTRRASARGRARSATASSGACSAASASRSSSSSRSTSAWRASTSTRSRAAPRTSGITSRRSQTRRWCSSSFIGSRTGVQPGARRSRGCRRAADRAAVAASEPRRGAMPARPGVPLAARGPAAPSRPDRHAVCPTSTASVPSSAGGYPIERVVTRSALVPRG